MMVRFPQLRLRCGTDMGLRAYRKGLICSHTRTVTDLKRWGGDVFARCSRCDTRERVDLDTVIEKMGPLYSFWNKHPPCPAESCDDRLYFLTLRLGDNVWPLHMKDGEPGQVAFLDAAWRADRVNSELGGQLALQVMVGIIRTLNRYSMFTSEERAAIIRDAVATLPPDRQDDATWLLNHY